MNISFSTRLKQVVTSLRSLGEHDPLHIDESGELHWAGILATLFVAVVVALVVHYELFVEIQSLDAIVVASEQTTVQNIDARRLQQLLEVYDTKAKLFATSVAETPSLVDPSR